SGAYVGSDWMSPSETTDSARVYTAQQSGRLVIESMASLGLTSLDGAYIKIMKNGTQIWPASDWQLVLNTVQTPANLMVEVNAGDKIYFVVNRFLLAAGDTLTWNPTISYDRLYYKASVGVSSTQGSNNWKYQEWNGSSYADMTWDATNSRWVGSSSSTLIGNNWQQPDTNDSARVFVAPQNGTIIISDLLTKPNTGSDGVNLKIIKNGTQIWPASGWRAVNVTTMVHAVVTTTVSTNDKIYFIVNKNGTSTNDLTNWDPLITYQ
ncbi:MAG TPA: hypothetical protein VGE40_04470, partial [Bacilli bacterium]